MKERKKKKKIKKELDKTILATCKGVQRKLELYTKTDEWEDLDAALDLMEKLTELVSERTDL